MLRFERLDIWHRSVEFANSIYVLSRRFPSQERFGLTSQLTRAAVSISANIAEGSSRCSDRDFSRFVEIAYGSLCETISHMRIARAQEFVTTEDYKSIYTAAEELGKMLTAFRNSLGQWKTVAEFDS